jgi:hypothetical protein
MRTIVRGLMGRLGYKAALVLASAGFGIMGIAPHLKHVGAAIIMAAICVSLATEVLMD